MSEYKKVEVIGAPGYEDFEGELIVEIPSVDGRLMSVVGWGKEDPHGFDVFESRYVQEIR